MLSQHKKAKHVECESSDDSEQDFFVGTITAEGTASSDNGSNNKEEEDIFCVGVNTEKKSNSDWSIYLCSNGTDVEYKVDTGAQVNILPKNIFNKLN